MDDIKKIKNENKKKIILLILTIIMFLGISLGAVYYRYFYTDERDNELATGLISINFQEGNGVVNLENQVPVIDEIGINNTPYQFTVTNTSAVPINIKIELEIQDNTTIPLGAVRYALYINDELVKKDNVGNIEDNIIYTKEYVGVNFNNSINAKIVFWVDYYYDTPGETFSAKIKATGESFDYIYTEPAKNIQGYKDYLLSNRTSTTIEEDGTIYISGRQDDYNEQTTDDVDYNYVWYSGKLWRITSIDPDGNMKLITEDLITVIYWGADTTYSTSWIREWLNQEFLPTLNNYENIIVEDAGWYSITDLSSTPVKPTGDYTLTDPVGLLNAYEYYKSYQKLGTSSTAYGTGYLNVGYHWWLITLYNTSDVRSVNYYGSLDNGDSPSSDGLGVRPSINLKSDVEFAGGDGSYKNPYTIEGDSEEIVNNTTLLNTRESGEYVKIENDTDTTRMFRIVGTELVGEKLTTKLVLNDYVKENGKTFSNYSNHSYTYGEGTQTNHWDYYLNNTYLGTLNTNMLEQGTYYLGMYPDATSYKATVCSSVDSTKSISTCITEGKVVDTTWTGYVGLLRVGEMFSNQIKDYTYENARGHWLITPKDTSSVQSVDYCGKLDALSVLVQDLDALITYSVRPSINLTSTVVIKSGTGTEWDPFVVGLPS